MDRLTALPHRIAALLGCRKGATAIEYALIAAFIALVIIGGVTAVGGTLSGTFSNVADSF